MVSKWLKIPNSGFMKHFFICLLLILSTKCVIAQPVISQKKDSFKTINGVASFYSSNLDGTKTATGEIFRNSKMTAASNHFKLNTWVRVTNLRNNLSVIVRINDRMHRRMAKKGRVVDLSRAAAKQLNFMKRGLTKVRVEEVMKGTTE